LGHIRHEWFQLNAKYKRKEEAMASSFHQRYLAC
jgi:hypothetical protein